MSGLKTLKVLEFCSEKAVSKHCLSERKLNQKEKAEAGVKKMETLPAGLKLKHKASSELVLCI